MYIVTYIEMYVDKATLSKLNYKFNRAPRSIVNP